MNEQLYYEAWSLPSYIPQWIHECSENNHILINLVLVTSENFYISNLIL